MLRVILRIDACHTIIQSIGKRRQKMRLNINMHIYYMGSGIKTSTCDQVSSYDWLIPTLGLWAYPIVLCVYMLANPRKACPNPNSNSKSDMPGEAENVMIAP